MSQEDEDIAYKAINQSKWDAIQAAMERINSRMNSVENENLKRDVETVKDIMDTAMISQREDLSNEDSDDEDEDDDDDIDDDNIESNNEYKSENDDNNNVENDIDGSNFEDPFSIINAALSIMEEKLELKLNDDKSEQIAQTKPV